MAVLESPTVYKLSVDELLAEMDEHQARNGGLTTFAFIRRWEDDSDGLEDIVDADLWYSAWIGYLDIKMGKAEPPPDPMERVTYVEEGSKEPSLHFWAGSIAGCEFQNTSPRSMHCSRISAGLFRLAQFASA